MYRDLIAQAETLAQIDARRPKQANLRRAISAAYYAVLHFLVHEACCVQFGSRHADAAYRQVLGRAFSHSTMKQACLSFGGGTLKSAVVRGLPMGAGGIYQVPQSIQRIAKTFAQLQERRHLADYDLNERFSRSDVLLRIERARSHIAEFEACPQSNDRKFFLACLWAWKDLASR